MLIIISGVYQPHEFGWINQQMSILRGDFLLHDLQPLLAGASISGAIAVQARSHRHPDFQQTRGCLPDKKVKGLRHIIQDEPDDQFILGRHSTAGTEAD